jgi:hypothetical protein
MKKYELTILLACAVSGAVAQAQKPAPVEDLAAGEGAVLQSQQRAGMAYRQLQQAQYETRLAEQDYLNAEDARRLAQKRADELRREAETAKKAFDAAKAKEAAARAAYEKEVNAVNQLQRKPQK